MFNFFWVSWFSVGLLGSWFLFEWPFLFNLKDGWFRSELESGWVILLGGIWYYVIDWHVNFIDIIALVRECFSELRAVYFSFFEVFAHIDTSEVWRCKAAWQNTFINLVLFYYLFVVTAIRKYHAVYFFIVFFVMRYFGFLTAGLCFQHSVQIQ